MSGSMPSSARKGNATKGRISGISGLKVKFLVIAVIILAILLVVVWFMHGSPPPPCLYRLDGDLKVSQINNTSGTISYVLLNLSAIEWYGCEGERIEEIQLGLGKYEIRTILWVVQPTTDENYSLSISVDGETHYYKVVNRISEWNFTDVNENGWMDCGDEISLNGMENYTGKGLYIYFDYAGKFAKDGKVMGTVGNSMMMGEIPNSSREVG